jgi:hypothetical protein
MRVARGTAAAVDRHATSDSGNPQDALTGVTDLIAVDDTPSVFVGVRVHPLGDPARTIGQPALGCPRR